MEKNYKVGEEVYRHLGIAKTVQQALSLLNSRKARPKPRLEVMRGSDDMIEWLKILGYSVMSDSFQVYRGVTNGNGRWKT